MCEHSRPLYGFCIGFLLYPLPGATSKHEDSLASWLMIGVQRLGTQQQYGVDRPYSEWMVTRLASSAADEECPTN